jgi:trafficking protein particle complex subunit 6
MSFETVMPPYNAADPTASFLNSSCLDFLLIELVPLAYRVTNELDATSPAKPPTGSTTTPAGTAATGGGGGATAPETQALSHNGATTTTSSAGGAVAGSSARKMDEEEERDAVFYRLEMLGYRVGQGLVER